MIPGTIALADFFRAYDRAGVLYRLLGPVEFVADDVFLTRSGAVGMILELTGLNFETASVEGIDKLWRVFAAALHRLGPRFRVKQYLIKRVGQQIDTWTEPDNPAARDWLNRRRDHLKVGSLRLWMVIQYEPKRSRLVEWYRAFSLGSTAAVLDQQLRDGIEIVQDAVTLLAKRLRRSLNPTVLDWRGVLRWLSEYYNPDPRLARKVAFHRDAEDVSYLAANTAIYNERKAMMFGQPDDPDAYKLRAWTMKQPPSRSLPEDRAQFPFLLREFQNTIDANMILTIDWKPSELEKTLRSAKAKRQIRRGQTGQSNKNPESTRGKEDRQAVEEVDELGATEVDMRRSRYGQFGLTVLLFDQDEARLRRAAVALDAVHWDGILLEFDHPKDRCDAWLASIPGNSGFSPFYRHWLSTLQAAELSLLFKLGEGDRENRHLRREYQSVFETPDSTPYYLSLHLKELAHTLVIGPPRAGKTALVNQLLGDARAKYGAYVWIIDINRGYKALTERLGGRYHAHDLENWKERIPLFQLEPTRRNLHMQHYLVRQLIESEGHVIQPDEDKDLSDRIAGMYETCEPAQRSLSQLNSILCATLKGKLHRWIGEGLYAPLFDNTDGTFELIDFDNFDFEALRDHPQAAAALRFYYFHQIDTLVRDRSLRHIPKVLAVDEGWSFLLDWILDAIKSWPKMNAWVMFITQSETDMQQSKRFHQTLHESCPNLFLLPSPGADVEVYGESFGLPPRVRHMITELVQPEFLFVAPPPRGIHKLIHNREPHWAAQYDAQNAAEEENTTTV